MPLPSEMLESLRADLEDIEKRLASQEDIIADLRASGIDASAQEAKLDKVREDYRQLKTFYELQKRRAEAK